MPNMVAPEESDGFVIALCVLGLSATKGADDLSSIVGVITSNNHLTVAVYASHACFRKRICKGSQCCWNDEKQKNVDVDQLLGFKFDDSFVTTKLEIRSTLASDGWSIIATQTQIPLQWWLVCETMFRVVEFVFPCLYFQTTVITCEDIYTVQAPSILLLQIVHLWRSTVLAYGTSVSNQEVIW